MLVYLYLAVVRIGQYKGSEHRAASLTLFQYYCVFNAPNSVDLMFHLKGSIKFSIRAKISNEEKQTHGYDVTGPTNTIGDTCYKF